MGKYPIVCLDMGLLYHSAVAKSVTKKLTHAVVGSDFGEKKMEQLKEVSTVHFTAQGLTVNRRKYQY